MLISKDENIKTSFVYVGFLILKELKEKEQLSIFDAMQKIRKTCPITYRQLTFSLMFLFASCIIDFRSPYIYKL